MVYFYYCSDIEDNDFVVESIFSERLGSADERADSEDDFDTEMEKEREARMGAVCHAAGGGHGGDMQVDADTTSGHSSSSSTTTRAVHTAARLADDLYDPGADDEDQKFIDSNRAGFALRADVDVHSNQTQQCRKYPNSDAVLNCPACMSLLSLDCQRHETYKTQYRAMFVFNCEVDFAEKLAFADKQPRKKRRKAPHARNAAAAQQSTSAADTPAAATETYYNVTCAVCKTQVAVYDEDEVYHFYNVLASYS